MADPCSLALDTFYNLTIKVVSDKDFSFIEGPLPYTEESRECSTFAVFG